MSEALPTGPMAYYPKWRDLPELRRTLPVLLEHCRTSFGANDLFIDNYGSTTYAQAIARSAVMARQLLDAGVAKGMRVGVVFPNCAEFIVAWFALCRVGAVAIPVSTLSTAEELAKLACHADMHMLISTGRYLHHDYVARLEAAFPGIVQQRPPYRLEAAPFLREIWIWGDTAPAWAKAVDLSREPAASPALLAAVEAQVHPADPISIIYTSGSTAEPKGIIHSQGNFMRQGWKLANNSPFREDDRIFTQMPFFWVGGLTFTLLCVMQTGTAMLYSSKTGAALLDVLESKGMTYFTGWPHLAKAVAADPTFGKRDWSRVRGGTMVEATPPHLRARNQIFQNCLGMTETCGPHHVSHVDLADAYIGSMGTPMPGMEGRIVDVDTGAVLGENQPGELQIRGDALMIGMVKRERGEIFDADGWYGTKDLCSYRDGHVFFHGRVDDMIKTSGANVSPREVEAALMLLPGVYQAMVSGVPDEQRGTVVGAIVVPKPGAVIDTAELRKEVAKKLSPYKVPRVFVVIEPSKLPTMSSSKLDRRALIRLLTEAKQTAAA
jgi:acyl-CoA synthetase (AMP-forming)/AMP-acid ligase II